jgi:hypothetical protein
VGVWVRAFDWEFNFSQITLIDAEILLNEWITNPNCKSCLDLAFILTLNLSIFMFD